MDYRALFRAARRRPDLYVLGSEVPTFDNLVAFARGVDAGSEGRALDGFSEFLVLKLDGPPNYTWVGLARLSVSATARATGRPFDLLNGLFDLLDEFFTVIGRSGRGRWEIHREHQLWRQSHPWYNLDLERFRVSPPGELVDVAQAADILSVSVAELQEMSYRGEVEGGMRGSQVLFRRADIETKRQRS